MIIEVVSLILHSASVSSASKSYIWGRPSEGGAIWVETSVRAEIRNRSGTEIKEISDDDLPIPRAAASMAWFEQA
jgi:hypothetical protein